MLKTLPALAALSFLILGQAQAAPVVNCSSPEWIEPAAITGGVFIAHLSGTCELTGITSGNIEKLYQYYLSQESVNIAAVNSAPAPDTSLAPTGTTADLTVNMDDGTMRSIIRIGTDSSSVLLYSSRSQEVRFSGFASLMQKLDLDIRVEKLSSDHFKITLVNLTHVKKPGIMPNFTFLGPARNQSIKQFQDSLNQLGKDVAAQL